tara:strand:+ start:901 stop:2022 length:1122 start_codon:yes stop_codon:yes gene_type:complete
MSSRLDIEITSRSDDAFYTWRALGAKEPKGQIRSSLLPAGTEIGDSLRVEAEFLIDGIEIIAVLPPRTKRDEPVLLELLGSGKSEPSVTTTLVKKKKKQKKGSKGQAGQKQRKPRNYSEENKPRRKNTKRQSRKRFMPPRGKRLKATKEHRNAYINSLPDSHKPLARELMGGPISKLRDTLARMDLPAGFDIAILHYAESLNTKFKEAEWMDRAESVERTSETVDLQDFRSVLASAGSWAKSTDAKLLKEKLETKLKDRIEKDHKEWLTIIQEALKSGKIVRALNYSSRPPKPGAQLPENLSSELIAQANESLGGDVNSSRWSVVFEAVAFSPIRLKVEPRSLPDNMSEDLKTMIRKHAKRLPAFADQLAESA